MSVWEVSIISFCGVSTLLVCVLLYPKKADAEKFTQLYLLSIVIKLLISGGFVVVFLILDPENAERNTVFFLVAYVIFTAAEVIFLLLKSGRRQP